MDLRIECLKKKYQPSSLFGVRFGSWAIQFLGENHGAKYFCMERSNFCMEQSVFDYGANWLFDYRAHLQFNSNTVAFFATKFGGLTAEYSATRSKLHVAGYAVLGK